MERGVQLQCENFHSLTMLIQSHFHWSLRTGSHIPARSEAEAEPDENLVGGRAPAKQCYSTLSRAIAAPTDSDHKPRFVVSEV